MVAVWIITKRIQLCGLFRDEQPVGSWRICNYGWILKLKSWKRILGSIRPGRFWTPTYARCRPRHSLSNAVLAPFQSDLARRVPYEFISTMGGLCFPGFGC